MLAFVLVSVLVLLFELSLRSLPFRESFTPTAVELSLAAVPPLSAFDEVSAEAEVPSARAKSAASGVLKLFFTCFPPSIVGPWYDELPISPFPYRRPRRMQKLHHAGQQSL